MRAPEGLPLAVRLGKPLLYKEISQEQLYPGVTGWPMVGTRSPEALKLMREVWEWLPVSPLPMISRG